MIFSAVELRRILIPKFCNGLLHQDLGSNAIPGEIKIYSLR